MKIYDKLIDKFTKKKKQKQKQKQTNQKKKKKKKKNLWISPRKVRNIYKSELQPLNVTSDNLSKISVVKAYRGFWHVCHFAFNYRLKVDVPILTCIFFPFNW